MNNKSQNNHIAQHHSSRTTPNSKDENNKNLNFFGMKNFFNLISPSKSDMKLSPQGLLESNRNDKSQSVFSNDEEINDLKCQLIYQANIIREYEGWVNIMINLINSKNNLNSHHDYATSVQKGLEKIENLELENFELKIKYLRELKTNKELNLMLEDYLSELENISNELKCNDEENLILEKNKLLESINVISEELDNFSQKNTSYSVIIKSNKELSEINQLVNELKLLKDENKELKEIQNLELKRNKSEPNHLNNGRDSSLIIIKRSSDNKQLDKVSQGINSLSINSNNPFHRASSK